MQTYLVGGAVRDALLGLAVKDRDWVVVGATPEEMVAQGFQPVGDDFPVFLHPTTKEEYALARTERKTAPGYGGFVFHADRNVTIEVDLGRRDLTVNAMALESDGSLIDPYGGSKDLSNRIFRHTSEAFSEDPVRILRLARFCARHPDFTVAPETMALMRQMTAAGEVDALVAERVWKELSRGLMEVKPSRMFETLRECGALARLFPELDCLWGVTQPPVHHPEVDTGVHVMMVVDMAARLNAPLPVRFSALCHDLGKGTTPQELWPKHAGHEIRSAKLLQPVCDRWKVPAEMRQTATVVAREHGNVHASLGFDAGALLRLLERCDAIRRPSRFEEVLAACECDARGRLGLEENAYPQVERLRHALSFARSVDTATLSARLIASQTEGALIGVAIHAARTQAIKNGFERLVTGCTPADEQANARQRVNDGVRSKIKHLRHLMSGDGNEMTASYRAKTIGLVRQALTVALEIRSQGQNPGMKPLKGPRP